jgi:hypothetical protein
MGAHLPTKPMVRSSSMARWYAYGLDRTTTAMSLLMVIGVGADGQKVLLGSKGTASESAASRRTAR